MRDEKQRSAVSTAKENWEEEKQWVEIGFACFPHTGTDLRP